MPRASVGSRQLGVATLALVSVIAAAAPPIVAAAEVPSPIIEGPVTGGGEPFIASTTFDLAEVGYEQAEYFISGTASAFTAAPPLTSDGRWTVTPGETAAYKTRVLVYRPTSRKKFNGTVIVEWLNVSGGLDASPDWTSAHTELIRDGFAWMGVSAQYAGVEGGGGIINIVSLPLKTVNPARYGSLVHPGDSFSYDIFSQAGQAIRHPMGTNPLGDLEVKKEIAAGDSQSAFRLVTYVDAVHPLAEVYDGILLVTGGADLGNSPAAADIVITSAPVPGIITCSRPINSGPQHFVLNAAFAALNRWVRTGKAPARAPRLEVAPGPPPTIRRDARGNALGGIRTPQVDVPIAAFTGEQDGSIICRLLGTTTLFDGATLASLYPNHRTYVAAFDKATKNAVRAGFILKPDAKLLKRWAAGSNVD